MKKNLGAKTALYPMPVLIIATYDKDGIPDAMNAAWGGISDTNEIGICLSKEHKTVANILERKAFTVSVADVENLIACDYVGIVSANDVNDKIERSGFHCTKSEFVDAPLIDELKFTLECELISYDEKTSHLYGKIVNLSVDTSILDDKDNVDLQKFKPITYDPINHNYIVLGAAAGKAFASGLVLKNKD